MEDTKDELLDRFLDGTVTKEEMNRIVSWLNTEQGEAAMSEQMDAVLTRAESAACSPAASRHLDNAYHEIAGRIRRNRIRRYAWRAAAALVPMLFVASLLYLEQRQTQLFSAGEYAEIATAKGERTQIVFQDGTRVYLNADSRLRYPVKFGFWQRRVYLAGEAYFNVRSNGHRPFVVAIDKAEVRVTGTSFDVRAYSDNPTAVVALDEGHVDLITANKTYSLEPSEEIRYDRTNDRIAIGKSAKRLSTWKENIIAFDKTSLEDVLRTLERWYGVEFEVKDMRVCRYSYTFTSDFVPLDMLLKDLELLAPVKFRRTDKKIEVFEK